jgi:hyperosmotically inducible periplasmic protein
MAAAANGPRVGCPQLPHLGTFFHHTDNFRGRFIMNTIPIRNTLIGVGIAIALGATAIGCSDREPVPAPRAQSENVPAAITDTALTATVKTRLMSEEGVDSADISVTTTNGVVTLEGEVSSSNAKAAAEAAARSVEGVRSVDNNLVTPTSSGQVAEAERVASDTWITTKVKSVLLADDISKGFDVNVDTRNGVVVLTGALNNEDAIAHVRDIAADVEGVKSVDTSNLKVAGKY